jgi:hypothetical protein
MRKGGREGGREEGDVLAMTPYLVLPTISSGGSHVDSDWSGTPRPALPPALLPARPHFRAGSCLVAIAPLQAPLPPSLPPYPPPPLPSLPPSFLFFAFSSPPALNPSLTHSLPHSLPQSRPLYDAMVAIQETPSEWEKLDPAQKRIVASSIR